MSFAVEAMRGLAVGIVAVCAAPMVVAYWKARMR